MTDYISLCLADAEQLAVDALLASRTSESNARATARALLNAEVDGQTGHGMSRIPSYSAQALSGKVNGHAEPGMQQVAGAAIRIDAGLGFAYAAINLAIEALESLSKNNGIAIACVYRSHHFGQAGAHAERLAEKGLVALVFGNSPKGIAFWGGKRPALGTNPIAFAAPLPEGPPLVIDMAMSVAARGKILAAQKNGRSIPEDWALDANGKSTTDPTVALMGSMLPIGGAKGAALALMVEILSAALTGSNFGFEASSLFDDKGEPPNLGQTILAIDADVLSGAKFPERMTALLSMLGEETGARLPGIRRLENRKRAEQDGIQLPCNLYAEIMEIIDR